MSIGIFDSGVGGLTVFKEISKTFPSADIYYLGDTARVPYGNKSKETIIRYSLECANYLVGFDIDILVVACNTASSYAIDVLKDSLNIPVIGVINPGVQEAVKVTKNKKIGVIGTYGTIRSNSYKNRLEELGEYQVYQKACPLFVPIVEEGLINHKITKLIIKEYLEDIVSKGIDTIILGCTHYPLLKDKIKEIYPSITIIDSSKATANYIKKLGFDLSGSGNRRIFITDESPAFENLKSSVVGSIKLEKIELSKICTL